MNQNQAPLFEALQQHVNQKPISYHVPGHKNGQVFDTNAKAFRSLLPYDLTELSGLDDLHQPEGVIQQAELLATELYKSKHTFFLVNGSTVGNLAMILSVCQPGDAIIVQRNSHKSVFNALELAGAKPIFISPRYDMRTERYSDVAVEDVVQAVHANPNAKALVLSYPDYFGTTYDLESMVKVAHHHHIPVLVDEAHGAHFPLTDQFPKSALEAGADIVVHSAHKTLPAMTMGSFLHIQHSNVSYETVKNYLQMLQSSSPSYPIMASLDLARRYASQLSENDIELTVQRVEQIREKVNEVVWLKALPIKSQVDDPLKITITSEQMDVTKVEAILHQLQVYPEMIQNNQMLLIAGLDHRRIKLNWLDELKSIELKLEKNLKHDTIQMEQNNINEFEYSYFDLKQLRPTWVKWGEAVGNIAAESIVPYPPGIPLLLKGETIQSNHVDTVQQMLSQGQYIQYSGKDLTKGIEILTS
ncbi:aminotransferase class I/II-fold pyridoxal phosphate-dependent enzyme [Piscibacillus sp. B03]|uniref:aminotransferase class I/II-fold pyridoxal phosphate-dependent enzyme n=1 Tax=Piscibacillus sp. B03 TaxID=3457430 RepID=UPI003FCE9AA4